MAMFPEEWAECDNKKNVPKLKIYTTTGIINYSKESFSIILRLII